MGGDARTVNFKLISAWRSTFTGSSGRGPDFTLEYGDGDTERFYAFEHTVLYDGDGYKLTSIETTHTYSSGGVYDVGYRDCCRIGSLENSANSDYSVYSGVELLAGYRSPVIAIPAILQTQVDQLYSQYMPAMTSTGGLVPCSESTSSGIDSTPKINSNVVSLAADPCQIQWDTGGGALGDLFAWQITYQNPGESSYMNLDFMLQVADGLPTCSFADGSTGQYVAVVGNTLTVDMDVEDPNNLMITMGTVPTNLRSGMSISPDAGWTVASPVQYAFTYTPGAADIGLSYSFATQFRNSAGGVCMLVAGITVIASPPPPPFSPPPPPPSPPPPSPPPPSPPPPR